MKVPDGYIEKLIDEYHDVLVKMCKRIVHYDPYYMHMIDDCLQEVTELQDGFRQLLCRRG